MAEDEKPQDNVQQEPVDPENWDADGEYMRWQMTRVVILLAVVAVFPLLGFKVVSGVAELLPRLLERLPF